MNGNKILLDTNILIYLLKGDNILLDFIKDDEWFISSINELELFSFPGLNGNKGAKALLSNCRIFGLRREYFSGIIQIRINHGIKLPDAIIAGTSICENIPLLTADSHFNKVKRADFNLLLYTGNKIQFQ